MDKRTISELVEAMKKDDVSAFEEIHRRYEKALYYMALKLTKNEADAQDMVQETFIKMRSSIHTLRNPEVFSLWLKRILYNRCKNMFRKNRNIYLDDMMLDSLNKEEQTLEHLPEAYTNHKAINTIILQCMNNLNDIYAMPLYLKYYKSMTMSEIASCMNIPTGTVKSRLRTAKSLLRSEIYNYEKENNMKVNFHGTTLGTGFALALWLKRCLHVAPTWATGGALTACVAVGGVVSVMAISQLPMFQNKNEIPNDDIRKQEKVDSAEISDMEAYYALRNWAHAKDDINKDDDIQSMASYFYQLQGNEGVYWELIQQDDWADTFLSIAK